MKTQAESSFKKIASHTLGIIGDTPENRSKVKQELEQYKEQILLGLSYINRFYNIQFWGTRIFVIFWPLIQVHLAIRR